jgi:prepilin-type N-terminal cleavage/methylation domain-containing protein/prepilin-type processing-associated H-X9-DG protein
MGFTLIELLIVLAIIALLAALAFPIASASFAKSNDAQCLSNMRRLYIGMSLFASDNNGNLPYDQTPGGSAWHNRVFPYIYPQADAEALNAAYVEWGDPTRLAANRKKYSVFYCPADTSTRSGKLSYGINFFLKTRKLLSIPAGTIVLADSFTPDDGGVAPYELRQRHMEQGSERHTGKKDHFVFADGHVEVREWPKYSTNKTIWDPPK